MGYWRIAGHKALMAPVIEPISTPFNYPLLPSPEHVAPKRGPDWVRRLAGWRGPEPTAVAKVFLLAIGVTAIADYRVKYYKAQAEAPSTGSVPQVSFAAYVLGSVQENHPNLILTLVILAVIIALAIVITIATRQYAETHFCARIVEAISSFDHEYVGAQIEIPRLTFNIWTGRFVSGGLVIHNPVGIADKEFFLKANHCYFGVELRKTFKTHMEHVYLSEFKLKGVNIKIASDALPYSGKTNLDVLLAHMTDSRPTAQHEADKEQLMKIYDAQLVPHDTPTRAEPAIINLKTVVIEDITVEKLDNPGSKIKLNNIRYEHFAEEEDHKHMHTELGHCHLDDMVYTLMQTVCKEIAKEIRNKKLM